MQGRLACKGAEQSREKGMCWCQAQGDKRRQGQRSAPLFSLSLCPGLLCVSVLFFLHSIVLCSNYGLFFFLIQGSLRIIYSLFATSIIIRDLSVKLSGKITKQGIELLLLHKTKQAERDVCD